MLKVFHLNVAKVDLDIAYVFAMSFKCFHVFQTYVASDSAVSDICCKRFYLDITKVDRDVTHVAMGATVGHYAGAEAG
jgi:hypothetical protein